METAFHWYQRNRQGRGVYFLQAVRATLSTIESNPGLYPTVHRDARRALVRGFPYAVFYIVRTERIEVIACMHPRRHPRRWRSRL